ncbi:MAG: cupin domain-containing protein [Blautia coccoides]
MDRTPVHVPCYTGTPFSRAPHAQEMEIGLVLDGNVEFTVNGNTNLLHSGDMSAGPWTSMKYGDWMAAP